jgi:hypothetical protein
MAIEKQVKVDQIEVTSNGVVQVRTATNIVEDGVIISQSFHRHIVSPGSDYSAEDEKVQAICAVAHTPEVIDAYNATIAAQGV